MRARFSFTRRLAPWPVLSLVAIALALGAWAMPQTANAQETVNVQIGPVEGSGVSGSGTLTSNGQDTTFSLALTGLAPDASIQVSLHAGTCAEPSASQLQLLSLTADSAGRASASGQVALSNIGLRPTDIAGGEHLIMVTSGGRVVGCGVVTAAAGDQLPAALLAAGEQHQMMQFNPDAALQRRIFADGFVPNSGEFSLTLEATSFAVQRAEHMGTGAVRVYYARTGDWGNVRFYQRGAGPDVPGSALLDEAERRQAIQFNPGAALQRRIFADGFVPNSGEFSLEVAGANYTAQRAEHLGTGRVRVYYAVTGQWDNVRYVQRD